MMKPIAYMLLLALMSGSCAPAEEFASAQPPAPSPGGGGGGEQPAPPPAASTTVVMRVGTASFDLILSDTPAAQAFVQLLPLEIAMDEMNGNEKYGYLPRSLPTSSVSPGTIQNGDVMLFGSDCLVVFYQRFTTSYSYTPIGRVDNPAGLAGVLGTGSVTLKFESINGE